MQISAGRHVRRYHALIFMACYIFWRPFPALPCIVVCHCAERCARCRRSRCRCHILTIFDKLSQYKSYQLKFVDGSGCDGRAGYRRLGKVSKEVFPNPSYKVWSRKKMAHSSSIRARWHYIEASIQYQGSTDSNLLKNFTALLLHQCDRYRSQICNRYRQRFLALEKLFSSSPHSRTVNSSL